MKKLSPKAHFLIKKKAIQRKTKLVQMENLLLPIQKKLENEWDDKKRRNLLINEQILIKEIKKLNARMSPFLEKSLYELV